MLLSILSKVFAGLLLGGIIGAIVTGDWIYTIVWSVALSAFLLSVTLGGVRGRAGRATGFAVARIETVTRTGRERDGMQELAVRVVVLPEGESAYQTTTIAQVAADDLRTFTPGAIVVVTRAGIDRPDVTIVPLPVDTHDERVQRARTDPSFIPPASSVPAWETATTTTPGTRRPGSPRVGRSAQATISLVIIAVVAAATTIPAWGSIARAAQSFAVGDWDGTNLISGNYQQEAVDAVAEVVGGYEFTRVGFYNTYLIVDAPTTPGASTTDTFTYRYGRAWREGPEFIQPTDVAAEVFDASGLDFGQVAAAVELTRQTSTLTNATYYASVSRDDEAGPVITVSANGDYGSETYTFDFDLTLLSSY
jgi:hypothetical protein